MEKKNIEFVISMSPSVNKLFKTFARNNKVLRAKSKEYREWSEMVSLELSGQKRYKVVGNEKLGLEVRFLTNWLNKDKSIKKKDVSNFIKAVEDQLGQNITNFDDSQFFEEHLYKVHSGENKAYIKIWEL